MSTLTAQTLAIINFACVLIMYYSLTKIDKKHKELLFDYKQLKNEYEHLEDKYYEEFVIPYIQYKELDAECDRRFEVIVHLEKENQALISENERLKHVLLKNQNRQSKSKKSYQKSMRKEVKNYEHFSTN